MMAGKERNCLGLGGDGDEIEVVEAVERAFGIAFTVAEAEAIQTVGNLYDLVMGRLKADDGPRRACLSAVSFYRLRRALARCGVSGVVTPKSDLNALFQGRNMGQAWKGLSSEAALELPVLQLSNLSHCTLGLILLSGIACAFALGSLYPAVLGLVLSLSLMFVMPVGVPSDYASMANLSLAAMSLNFAKFSRAYQVCHPEDVWRALVVVVVESSGTGFKRAVDRNTRFFC